MTSKQDLDALLAITRAQYGQKEQNLTRLNGEETRIRCELNKLDAMERSSRETKTTDVPMRALGADVIWQGWVGRAKTSLNIELARVLAQKEQHLAEVRRAYGKVLVVEELLSELSAEKRQKQNARRLDQAIELTLLR